MEARGGEERDPETVGNREGGQHQYHRDFTREELGLNPSPAVTL